jgi:MOSC domain-containing protein YiiM
LKILSIQVGLPKTVLFRGKRIDTGIFKSPVSGPVYVRATNLDGDRQADLSVHGGSDKAVYAYSMDAYPWWRVERPQDRFDFGAFGENLSIDALPEDRLFIGDTFEVGEAVIQITQPRFPCYKLGVKFNDPAILKSFMESQRPGVYFRVLKEGAIRAGQELTLLSRESVLLSVAELFTLQHSQPIDLARVKSYLRIASLPDAYKAHFQAIVDEAATREGFRRSETSPR